MKRRSLIVVILSLLCALFSQRVSSQVVINEIMWDEQEYIELRNTGGSAVDIAGWLITAGGDTEIVIDAGATIPAGGFYLIADANAVTVTPNEIDAMNFNQSGELVVLFDTLGIAIDTANRAGAWYAGVNSSEGVSMSRVDTPGDGTLAANWKNDLGYIGGRFGSPGSVNVLKAESAVVQPGAVVINEIMWDELEYIELRNTTSETVNIADWTITASGNVEAVIDAGATIKPGGFYLVGDSGAVSFGMDDTDAIELLQGGETVQLIHANGVAIDTANNYGAWFAGQNTAEGQSMSRKTPPGDGHLAGNWADDSGLVGGRNGSPGAQNRFTDGILFKSLPLEGENPVLVAGDTLRFEAQLLSQGDSSPIVGESVLFVFSDIFGNGLQQSMGVTDSNGAVSIDFDTTAFLQSNPLNCVATAVFLADSSVQIEWPFRIAEPGNTGIFVDSEFYYRVEVLPPTANVRYETDLSPIIRSTPSVYDIPLEHLPFEILPFVNEEEFLDALQVYNDQPLPTEDEGPYAGEGIYELQRLLHHEDTRVIEAVLARVVHDSDPVHRHAQELTEFGRSQEPVTAVYLREEVIPTLWSLVSDSQVNVQRRSAIAETLWFYGERKGLLWMIYQGALSGYTPLYTLAYPDSAGRRACDPAIVPFLRKLRTELPAGVPAGVSKFLLQQMGLEPLD